MRPVIVLEDVWARYGPTVALAGVSLELGGGLTLVMGPNGSGKTTLLRVIAGLRRPNRGRVLVYGSPPHGARRRPLVAGMVGEGLPPYWMRAREYLEYVDSLTGAGRALHLALRLGLGPHLDKYTWQLSSGNLQRLRLAAALTGRGLLLLDEPLARLDPASAIGVSRVIAGEAAGRPAIVATHIVTPPLAEAAARILVMAAGRIALDIDPRRPEGVEHPVFLARQGWPRTGTRSRRPGATGRGRP